MSDQPSSNDSSSTGVNSGTPATSDRPWWVPAHATSWHIAGEKPAFPPPYIAAKPDPIDKSKIVPPTTPIVLPEGAQFPTFRQMAANMASTVSDALITAAKTGNLIAPEDVSNARMDTCQSCEFFNAPTLRCTQCGCYMAAKVKILASKCPKDKWTA